MLFAGKQTLSSEILVSERVGIKWWYIPNFYESVRTLRPIMYHANQKNQLRIDWHRKRKESGMELTT